MHRCTVSLFTRTPLHVGCGSAVGVVDLPTLRERATGFPTLPGSALKGVLADLFLEGGRLSDEGLRLFGEQSRRGAALIGEARLAAFPVRSARQGFAWLVSPLTLGRLGVACPPVGEEETLAAPDLAAGGQVVLEEYALARAGDVPQAVLEALRPLCDESLWQETLPRRLAVVSDTLLQYFALNACEIAQHNRIDDETGTVEGGALFAQENVPSETLFVGAWMADAPDTLATLRARVAAEGGLLQVGADATTGLGWCHLTIREA